ncbi:MAG TPA: hypothetical protein VLL27_13005 [Solirubrobacterales bacterium]|nr:hypothetical protein [Solirubrobacterales bacterium]
MPGRTTTTALVLASVAAIALAAIPGALAAFGARAENPGNIVTAAPDFRPPIVTATAIGKTVGGATGFVKQGSTYYVYAAVAADTGNPASGIASVSANVETITTGSTAVPLTAGTYSAGSVSYNYRSAALTAAAVLTEGVRTFKITATDNAANANTLNGEVTIDNTAPKAVDVQSANGGTTVGLAEEKDSLTYTFSEPIEPESILAGWTGGATNVTVRVVDNGLLATGNDAVQIYDSTNATLLPLGTVDLGRGDYAAGLLGGTYRFVNSKMTISGNTITIVFGTYSSTIIVDAGRTTAAASGTMAWTPVATPYDRAQNAMSTTAATESGAADKEF